ncbi:hypothetical protein SG34_014165 [Thalassomonas viridans]|uniref:Pre-toxin TG domain-containing protein n=1 Tax=Thalassomonas viridans TaxID=137584 RepID=A0AAE9Z6Z4_9GAMM|nr:hypothetical protein [Thalassomonas viridans]WDE07926.1 hypothetical protein SG34_014165 [Thalassomonas viridans]
MKPYQKRILLPFLLISQQALAADVCEVDKSTLESNLTKVETTVDTLAETELPSATKLSMLAELTPKLTAFVDVLGKIGTAAGLGIGVYEIADGAKSHNSSEIIDGSLNIASVVAPEIVSTIVGELAGEAIGGIAGGAAAFVVIEGLDIYNGVKVEKVISSIKHQNAKLSEVYGANVAALEKGLSDTRRVIAGDSEELYKITTENFGRVAVELTKRSIDTLGNTFYLREMGKQALKLSRENHDENILTYAEKGDTLDKDVIKQSLELMNYNLRRWYSIEKDQIGGEGNGRPVNTNGVWNDYFISNNYYWGLSQATPDMTASELEVRLLTPTIYSKGVQSHFIPLAKWAKTTLDPIVTQLVDAAFDDKQALAKDYHAVLEQVLNNYPKLQEQMLESYNQTIAQRYSWLKFGQELMGHLDYSDEKTIDALIWTFRILNPFAASFAEGALDKKLIESVNVSHMVSSVVSHLITSGVGISAPGTYDKVRKLFAHEKAPSAVTSAFDRAFSSAKSAAEQRLLTKSAIKPVNLTKAVINEHLAKTKAMVNDGTLKRMLDQAINNHLREKVFIPQLDPLALAEFTQAASKIHWAYNKTVVGIINEYQARLADIEPNDKQKMADMLLNLKLDLLANYSSFKQKDLHVDPRYKWVSFNTLPHPASELDSIGKYIDATTNNL